MNIHENFKIILQFLESLHEVRSISLLIYYLDSNRINNLNITIDETINFAKILAEKSLTLFLTKDFRKLDQ